MKDRDVGPGQIFPLFIGIAVNRVIDEVGANAAVIQKGISLAGRAVAGDRSALVFSLNQKIQEQSLRFLYLLCERRIGTQVGVPLRPVLFASAQPPGRRQL